MGKEIATNILLGIQVTSILTVLGILCYGTIEGFVKDDPSLGCLCLGGLIVIGVTIVCTIITVI